MPSFSIIDTHVHLWNPGELRYPWLDDLPLLNKPYLPPDYYAATRQLSIEKTVFVQCECTVEQCEKETEWVTSFAKLDEKMCGIVAWAPLENGKAAAEVLERYTDNKLVKGIRRIIQYEPDPGFCLTKEFIEGVQLLTNYNFSFDICVSHLQLEYVVGLVRACPKVQFILDHMGKPDIRNQRTEPWRSQVRQLSEFENVYCKVSGLVTEADHNRWESWQLQPFIDTVIEYFTPDRLIFGGDWPVVTQAANYQKWVDTLDSLLIGLHEQQLVKIYRTNAEQFYRLH